MSAHTPGPWRYDYETGYCGEIIASNGKEVATFTDEPNAPDARLIAAAPELLLALRSLMNLFEQHEKVAHITSPVGNYARAAIAKATGGEA